jgi:hypothetical protein
MKLVVTLTVNAGRKLMNCQHAAKWYLHHRVIVRFPYDNQRLVKLGAIRGKLAIGSMCGR